MADETKTLEILLQYGVDQAALGKATSDVNQTTSALQRQEQQLHRNRMEIRELSQVFTLIGVAGAAVWAPAIAAANQYVSAAGQTQAASAKWLATTNSIKTSTQAIGKVVVEDLLPAYEQAAQLAERFAAWAEKNPEAVKAALNIAGGLVLVGTVGTVLMQVARGVVDIQLIAATLMNSAADKQLAAATQYGVTGGLIGPAEAAGGGIGATLMASLGTVLPVLIPIVVAGVAATLLLKQTPGGQAYLQGVEDRTNQLTHPGQAAADSLNKVAVAADKASDGLSDVVPPVVYQQYEYGVKSLDNAASQAATDRSAQADAAKAAQDAKDKAAQIYQQGLDEYTTYQQQLVTNQQNYDSEVKADTEQTNAQLLSIQQTYNANKLIEERNFAESEARALQDYQQSQATATRNFEEQQAQSEASFQQSQSDAAAAFQQSELDAQQSYQNQVADLNQSHQDRLRTLTESHDWLGMDQENTAYKEQQAQDKRNYDEAEAKRKSDYATQQADAQRNFNEQQAQAQADYKQQQADAAANYALSDARRKEDFAKQQADEAANEQAQLNATQAAHDAKMTQLAANLKTENATDEAAFQQRLAVIDGYLGASGAALVAQMQITKNAYDLLMSGMSTTQITPASTQAAVAAAKSASGYDSGGYFPPGLGRNASGQNEFIASPDTVKYAESIIGGRLTQQNLIAAMISGRSGGSTGGAYNRGGDTFNMNGMTAQDRLIIGEMLNRAIDKKLAMEFRQ